MSKSARHADTSRTRRTGALRAASVLTGAGVAVLALTGCTAAQAEPTATALQLPASNGGGAPAALCAELSAQYLSGAPRAFRAQVISTDGDRVVLDVTDTYAGDVGERVTLPQQSSDLPSEMSVGFLEVGQTYLITADGDAVRTCGASGPATPELQAVYDAAF